ncbi:uncharacterized protein An01g08070 [Aspergillus niger]|uniref:Contig An01c0290, genomic contig n=2 Tax=Aspergillus niger TaxID=5061 RepID=A2Q9J3_ASPNC|nr:uncharacterized protein An01g08070 [Aspergillus niger]CAK43899.1 unnamed protein product [Aspergillus niger]
MWESKQYAVARGTTGQQIRASGQDPGLDDKADLLLGLQTRDRKKSASLGISGMKDAEDGWGIRLTANYYEVLYGFKYNCRMQRKGRSAKVKFRGKEGGLSLYDDEIIIAPRAMKSRADAPAQDLARHPLRIGATSLDVARIIPTTPYFSPSGESSSWASWFPWEKGRVSKEAREVQYVKRVLDACLSAHVVFPFLSIADHTLGQRLAGRSLKGTSIAYVQVQIPTYIYRVRRIDVPVQFLECSSVLGGGREKMERC